MLSAHITENYEIDYDIDKYIDGLYEQDCIIFKLLCDEYKILKGIIHNSNMSSICSILAQKKDIIIDCCRVQNYDAFNSYVIREHPQLLYNDVQHKIFITSKRYFPVIDSSGRLIAVICHKPLLFPVKKNPVVIMAGGLGRRLWPYTKDTPKPLLNINSVSILERILACFKYYGFYKFYISVNYCAQKIQNTFGNGEQYGINIQYLHEENFLGTAGALSLMSRPDTHCFVSNGDIITDVNLLHFLKHHIDSQSLATMCIYQISHKIEYGVVNYIEDQYLSITEKPEYNFFINTGLYCISPEAWDYFVYNKKQDMPSVFDLIKQDNRKTGVYQHKGKWMDIGTIPVFEQLLGKVN